MHAAATRHSGGYVLVQTRPATDGGRLVERAQTLARSGRAVHLVLLQDAVLMPTSARAGLAGAIAAGVRVSVDGFSLRQRAAQVPGPDVEICDAADLLSLLLAGGQVVWE